MEKGWMRERDHKIEPTSNTEKLARNGAIRETEEFADWDYAECGLILNPVNWRWEVVWVTMGFPCALQGMVENVNELWQITKPKIKKEKIDT